LKSEETQLTQAGKPPIGSRRRRAALQHTDSVPFSALPYQCFQEARAILIADRNEKLKQIEIERERLERARAIDPDSLAHGQKQKDLKIKGLEQQIEKLKILADINDPNVKRRFEDGQGQYWSSVHITWANML
jgi:large subunit ribosomal protein L35